MDRWIEYQEAVFNMKYVAYFDTFKGEIYAYMNFGISYEAPGKMTSGMDGGLHTHCLFLGRHDEEGVDAQQVIRDIVAGKYDMKKRSPNVYEKVCKEA